MALARLGSISLDCDDPVALGAFWASLLGGEAEALRLGARLARVQPGPDRYRVLFDPAGHPFCLTTQIPE